MLAANGLGVFYGAAIEIRQLSFALKLNRITDAKHLTSSRIIANTMLAAVLLLDFHSVIIIVL